MQSYFKKNNLRSLYGKVLIEGIVVSLTEYVMLGSFVLINIMINQIYGAEVLGVYVICFSIAQIGILGTGSVFSLLIRRDFSVKKYVLGSYIFKVQLLRFTILLLVFFLAIFVIVILYQPLRNNLLLILLMIVAKGFDALSETYTTAYQSLNRIGEYSVLRALNAIVVFVVSFLVCFNHYQIEYLYWSQFVCSLVFFGVNSFQWRKTKGVYSTKNLEKFQNVTYRFLLVESFPLMVSALVFQTGQRLSNVLIFDQIGERDLGLFSIVAISIGIFTGVANALGIVFFGRLSRVFVENPESFVKRMHQVIGLFVALGIACYLLYLAIIPASEYMFGLKIDEHLYKIMSFSIPFIFVISCLGSIFTIIKKQKIGMYLSVIVLMFNLSNYYFLTKQFGVVGAGYAFLITVIFQSVSIYFAALIVIKLNFSQKK